MTTRCTKVQTVLFASAILINGPVYAETSASLIEPDIQPDAQHCESVFISDPAQNLADYDFDDAGVRQNWQGQYTLRNIEFYRQNIFPHDTHWLARQANRLNIVTREDTLRSALTLRSGDRVNQHALEETERELRRKSYLYDARVLVTRICGDAIDIIVIVRDVWTLTPGLSVSRSGGENTASASFSDTNALGYGKSIALEYFDDEDRSGTLVDYYDPNFRGTRWSTRLSAADNDDGQRYVFRLSRPFYSLDTNQAFGLSVSHFKRDNELEFLSRDIIEYTTETDQANIYYARLFERSARSVNRWFIGMRLRDEHSFSFDPIKDQVERKFIYPYVAWQRVSDNFITAQDIERIDVTEDVALGLNFYAEIGADDRYLHGRLSSNYRKLLDAGHLLSGRFALSARRDNDRKRTEDLVAELSISALIRQSDRLRFYIETAYVHTHGLLADTQLTLGGDSGLRGYPNRYQPGDRSARITIEERYYSNWSPLDLFRVGYATFVDAGRAWFDGPAPIWMPPREGDHFGTLVNVGLGIRLESIRTRRDQIFHIDIATPLVDGPDIGSWELTLSVKQRF